MRARTRYRFPSSTLTFLVCALGVEEGITREVRAQVIDEQYRGQAASVWYYAFTAGPRHPLLGRVL